MLSARVLGTAVEGSRSGRNALGLGSSSEAVLLSDSMSVQQIDTVCTPSQAVNSVSSTVAILLASLLCSGREDSPTGAAGFIYVLVTEEAKTDRIPSPEKGLIKRGFFGPRVVSPSTLVVKEAFMSSQSFKDDRSLGAVELCKVREVESISFLGSNSVSPSLPMLIFFRFKG